MCYDGKLGKFPIHLQQKAITRKIILQIRTLSIGHYIDGNILLYNKHFTRFFAIKIMKYSGTLQKQEKQKERKLLKLTMLKVKE